MALPAELVAARACDADVHYTYNEPVEIEGVLKSGTGHHEAQGDFVYTYLALDKPICVDAPKDGGDDDFGNTAPRSPVDRIQIAGEASQQRCCPADGARVYGEGHALWRPHHVARRARPDRRRQPWNANSRQ